MRHLMGASILALSLALSTSAHAEEWFRLKMGAPILFGEGIDGVPDMGGNNPIEITAEAQSSARAYGAVSIAVMVTGIDGTYTVDVSNRPAEATWDGNAIHWAAAVEGTYTPTIEVRDGNGILVASQDLELTVHGPLTASTPQTSYEVGVGDALTITPTATNAISDLQWGSTPAELPEWLEFNASTGAIDVDTSSAKSLEDLVLTAVDQGDLASASTSPFSIAVYGPEWVTTFGSGGNDVGFSFAVAHDGSLYAVGSTNAAGAGGTDILVAKYDASGALQWQRTIGGSSADTGYSVALGSDGSVYISGSTNSAGAGGSDFFLTKLDASGALQWQQTLGGSGTDYGYSVDIGPDGSVYIGGRTTSVGAGGYDGLLAKFDATGSMQWQRRIGTSSHDKIQSVAIGSDGSVFVGGTMAGTGAEAFLAKYDASGTLLWPHALLGSGIEEIESIAIGPDGSLYAVGYTTSAGAGGHDVFLAKYDTTGNVQWQRTLGGSGTDYGKAVYVGSDGAIYVSGYTTSVGAGGADTLLAKYDASGDLHWQRTLGGSGTEHGNSVSIGSDGSIYVGGITNSSGAGSNDFMIARLPVDGEEDMVSGPFAYHTSDLTSEPTTLEAIFPIIPHGGPNFSSPSSDLSAGTPTLSSTTTKFKVQ